MTEFLNEATNWVLISFILFIFVFIKYAKAPLLAKLDERIANIRKELETVEALRIEAQEMLAQYQRKHRDAMKEADDIIKQAREHAEKIRVQTEAEMQDIKNRREKQLDERLSRIEDQAMQEIRSYAIDLSVQAAEELIKRKMDSKAEKTLADDTVRALPSYLN